MIIERGKEAHYQGALQLVKNFYNEALKEYDPNINEKYLLSTFDKLKNNSFLLIIDGKVEGLIAGQSVNSPINQEKVYQEIIWYVNEPHRRYGVYLLKEAMKQLKEEGYSAMVMVCLHNSMKDKLFEFYQRIGFAPMEYHFLRRL